MPKLAPAPAQPIDLVPTERRRESQVLPQALPIEARGPDTDRFDERRSIAQRLSIQLDSVHSSQQPQQPSPKTGETVLQEPRFGINTSEASRKDSPVAAPSVSQSSSPSEIKDPGFFTSLKNKVLGVLGFGEPKPAQEPVPSGGEKPGLFARIKAQFTKLGEVTSLSSLISWGKGFACAAFPSLNFLFRPTIQTSTSTPLIRDQRSPTPVESSAGYLTTAASRTHHSDDKLIIEDAPRKVDLAAKGLEAVAQAKREQTAHEDKKKHIEQDFKDREKAKLRAALTKLAGGGINQGDLSAIIAELEGVYGSAEVALRQATELATKKKLS